MDFQRFLYGHVFKYFVLQYLKFNTSVIIDGLKLKILKGVFHPKLYFSSHYFFDFLSGKNLKNRTFLEIGCGSGVLSLLAHKKGATVTTTDIDERAVETTKINFEKNFGKNHGTRIIQSNMFQNLPIQKFEIIVINPPYYFKKIESAAHYAWYCGEQGEYFEELFGGIKNYINVDSEVFMILEEKCEIERIKAIAQKNQLKMIKCDERKIKWEINYIFSISLHE
jgi:release factor glutamine methyltransferase